MYRTWLTHTVTASALMVSLAFFGSANMLQASPGNDPTGDEFIPGGPDIESLTTLRTDTALVITLALAAGTSAPTQDGSGLFGFIDLDVDRSGLTGQQSAIDFLGASQTPALRSHLGVEYQLVLSSWSSVDGAIDLVDQTTQQTVARVSATFQGSTLTVTIPETALSPEILDGLHLAAVVGSNEAVSDVAPNQGFVTTATAEGDSLHNGRFTVSVEWTNFQDENGVGTLVTKSNDSALFWFFQDSNWELLAKVLDGCAINNRFWVFSAATTNVGFTLQITDTSTGTVRVYENPLGTAAPAINDIDAFASCPQ